MRIFFLIFLFSCASRNSGPDICKYLKLDNCNNSKRSLSRSAGASLPSVNAAAFSNPAAIALSKGWGLESIHYAGEAQLGIVYGTGRIGGAIASGPNDGTFFGNLAVEEIQNQRIRILDRERFKEDKFVFSGATNLFGGDKKKGFSLDVGVMIRRQLELEETYYGGGVTLSYNRFVSIGFAKYNDIHYQDLSGEEGEVINSNGTRSPVIFPDLYVIEVPYSVESQTYGLKFSNVALDYIRFFTTYEDDYAELSEVNIWNLSYFYQTWIFTYGRRHESSYKEVYEDQLFVAQDTKDDVFLGLQYATKNGLLLGAFTNYYLLDDLSFGLTYFF